MFNLNLKKKMCLTLFSWMLKEITQLKIVLGNILLLNLLMAITNMRLTSKNMVNKMPRSSLDSRNYHLFFKFHWTDTNTVPTKTRWLRTTNNSNLVKFPAMFYMTPRGRLFIRLVGNSRKTYLGPKAVPSYGVFDVSFGLNNFSRNVCYS